MAITVTVDAEDASEGLATVTVQATVDVPASGTTPSHFVITDPVSATLTVKKGVKTLTFEASELKLIST